MTMITIPKIKYQVMLRQANAYRKIASSFALQMIETPVKGVVDNFRVTGKYSTSFLDDLEDGLNDLRNSRLWKSK